MNERKFTTTAKPVKTSLLEQRWFELLIKLTQRAFRPPVKLLAPLFVYHSVSLLEPDQLKADRRIIISSNHQCRIDHFLILAALPGRYYRQLVPYRFFTANDLFFFPLNYILLLCGSFPAFQHRRWPYGLEMAERLLNRQQTLFIFPEGKRSQWRQRPARSGVAVLAQAAPSCDILPASVLWRKRGWFRQCSVVIGQPTSARGLSASQILELSFKLGPHHR